MFKIHAYNWSTSHDYSQIHDWLWCVVSDRALSQYKGYFSWYRDSYYKDKMVYWESPQIVLNNILYGYFTDIEITI